jgi:hypothetical protein
MYGILSRQINLETLSSVLDVGVTSDRNFVSSNFFEALFPHKDRITALSDQDASWMEETFPGLRFVHGDGCRLPFDDCSFDLVFSSAVVEHVGTFERQLQFIRECVRVAKRYAFITTPNRWHPLEFHSVLPLLHWLPKSAHRKLLVALRKEVLSREENLNLLSARDLKRICEELRIQNYEILYARFLGFRSNLLLLVRRR